MKNSIFNQLGIDLHRCIFFLSETEPYSYQFSV